MTDNDCRDAKTQRVNKISNMVIGAEIEVHKTLGPSLLESVYQECLCVELEKLGLYVERQILMPITYKGKRLEAGFRLDIFVEKFLLSR